MTNHALIGRCAIVVALLLATPALLLDAQDAPKAPAVVQPQAPAEDAPKTPPPPPPEKALTRDEIFEQDIDKAIQSLSSDRYLESGEAKKQLLEIGNRALPKLLKALDESKVESRYLVCEILGDLRNGAAVSALLKRLTDKEVFGHSVASAAARALGRIGDERAIPELLKVLESTDAKVDVELRLEAIRALGNLRALEAVDGLKKFLDDKSRTTNERIVCCATIEALGKIRAKGAVEEIAKKLLDKETEQWSGLTIEIHAARALGLITGLDHGPIFEATDPKSQETLKKWNEWRQAEEAKKKTAEQPKVEPPKTPEPPKSPAPPAPPEEKQPPKTNDK